MSIEPFRPDLVDAVESLERRYFAGDPGERAAVGSLKYANPLYERGRNILCALSHDELCGYGLVLPIRGPAEGSRAGVRSLQIAIRIDPACPTWEAAQGNLYAAVMQRVESLAASSGDRAALHLRLSEKRTRELGFFEGRGWRWTDAVQQMRRPLDLPIPAARPPAGARIRPWPLDTPAKVEIYAAAEAAAFPKTVRSAQRIGQQVRSWAGGTPLVAFDERSDIVGSTMLYWWNSDGEGFTEDVFVLPPWRRRGLARHLLCAGLSYLRDQGRPSACLEVLDSNVAAKSLYNALGYRVTSRALLGSLEIGHGAEFVADGSAASA